VHLFQGIERLGGDVAVGDDQEVNVTGLGAEIAAGKGAMNIQTDKVVAQDRLRVF